MSFLAKTIFYEPVSVSYIFLFVLTLLAVISECFSPHHTHLPYIQYTGVFKLLAITY